MINKLLLPFLFFFNLINYSQVDSDISDFFSAGKEILSSPLNFSKKDWTLFSSVIGTTSISFLVDNNFKDIAIKNYNSFNSNLFSIDNVYGNFPVTYGMVGIYSYGLFFKDKNFRKIGLRLIEASSYAGLITTVLKFSFGRSRPYLNEGNTKFQPFSTKGEYNALPSGHTTWAFAVSTVMANEIDNFFWKAAWFSAAGLVGAARIYHNAHWFSDVVLGGCIGYFTADFICNRHIEADKNSSSNFYYYPYFTSSKIGILISF